MQLIKPSFTIEDTIDGIAILKKIEKAGRTCYKSEVSITEESACEFVAKIIKNGHHSVLEHEKVSVRVVCDRGVSHEIVRHRIASYSQESTRYCNYSTDKFNNEITFILPCWIDSITPGYYHDLREQASTVNYWFNHMLWSERTYMYMIKNGWSSQEARSILTNSLKTEIVMTMNLREWRHFFTLRTAPAAHPQMREIAQPMLDDFKRLIPIVFEDIQY